MLGIRICLAFSQIEEMKKVKTFLAHQGFEIIDESTDGSSAIRRIRTLHPDLIIADSNLPGISGIRIAEIAEEDGIAPVIVITSMGSSLWINQENTNGIIYLQRPITKAALLQTIQLALISYQKVMNLKKEIQKLKETLEDRKLIEKAKGIVMQKYNLSENEAYRLIQKMSMNKGIPLRELAKAILLANDL